MNVIVHYPKSAEALTAQQNNVAKIHIDAVMSYINSLSCPKEQKLQLLNSLKTDSD